MNLIARLLIFFLPIAVVPSWVAPAWVKSAWAAPVHDASSTATPVSSGTSISVVHAVGGGCANPIIICAVCQATATPEAPLTFTWNGIALTAIGDVSLGSTTHRLDVRRYVGATGSQTVQATFTNTISNLILGVSSYCDVDQTTPLGTPATASDHGTAVTVAASSAIGELVVDMVCDRNSGETYTVDGSQTQRFQTGGTTPNALLTSSSEAGAASVTMSGTISAAQYWGTVAVALKPAAGGAVRRRVIVVQ